MVDFDFRSKLPLALGQVVATPAALAALEAADETPLKYLIRHASGDWGSVCEEDAELNNQAVLDGERVLSCYDLPNDTRIWIITERDRSATTILLPSEY